MTPRPDRTSGQLSGDGGEAGAGPAAVLFMDLAVLQRDLQGHLKALWDLRWPGGESATQSQLWNSSLLTDGDLRNQNGQPGSARLETQMSVLDQAPHSALKQSRNL